MIQEDGTTDAVLPHVPDDARVTFRQGRPGGPGVARTIALAHAEGTYVKVLDADDQLTPGAPARDLAALERDPGIGWATSRVLDLLPDGSTAGFPGDPEGGPLERGAVLEHWRANGFLAQVPGQGPGARVLRLELSGRGLTRGGGHPVRDPAQRGLVDAVHQGLYGRDVVRGEVVEPGLAEPGHHDLAPTVLHAFRELGRGRRPLGRALPRNRRG